uniref:Uncharacterized protein n=2 Tax=Acrobeloides nanus TaxID=290746 RepID=A0A914CI41_9BILA
MLISFAIDIPNIYLWMESNAYICDTGSALDPDTPVFLNEPDSERFDCKFLCGNPLKTGRACARKPSQPDTHHPTCHLVPQICLREFFNQYLIIRLLENIAEPSTSTTPRLESSESQENEVNDVSFAEESTTQENRLFTSSSVASTLPVLSTIHELVPTSTTAVSSTNAPTTRTQTPPQITTLEVTTEKSTTSTASTTTTTNEVTSSIVTSRAPFTSSSDHVSQTSLLPHSIVVTSTPNSVISSQSSTFSSQPSTPNSAFSTQSSTLNSVFSTQSSTPNPAFSSQSSTPNSAFSTQSSTPNSAFSSQSSTLNSVFSSKSSTSNSAFSTQSSTLNSVFSSQSSTPNSAFSSQSRTVTKSVEPIKFSTLFRSAQSIPARTNNAIVPTVSFQPRAVVKSIEINEPAIVATLSTHAPITLQTTTPTRTSPETSLRSAAPFTSFPDHVSQTSLPPHSIVETSTLNSAFSSQPRTVTKSVDSTKFSVASSILFRSTQSIPTRANHFSIPRANHAIVPTFSFQPRAVVKSVEINEQAIVATLSTHAPIRFQTTTTPTRTSPKTSSRSVPSTPGAPVFSVNQQEVIGKSFGVERFQLSNIISTNSPKTVGATSTQTPSRTTTSTQASRISSKPPLNAQSAIPRRQFFLFIQPDEKPLRLRENILATLKPQNSTPRNQAAEDTQQNFHSRLRFRDNTPTSISNEESMIHNPDPNFDTICVDKGLTVDQQIHEEMKNIMLNQLPRILSKPSCIQHVVKQKESIQFMMKLV